MSKMRLRFNKLDPEFFRESGIFRYKNLTSLEISMARKITDQLDQGLLFIELLGSFAKKLKQLVNLRSLNFQANDVLCHYFGQSLKSKSLVKLKILPFPDTYKKLSKRSKVYENLGWMKGLQELSLVVFFDDLNSEAEFSQFLSSIQFRKLKISHFTTSRVTSLERAFENQKKLILFSYEIKKEYLGSVRIHQALSSITTMKNLQVLRIRNESNDCMDESISHFFSALGDLSHLESIDLEVNPSQFSASSIELLFKSLSMISSL